MGHWRGLKGCRDPAEKVWAGKQVEGGAGNVILALAREKSFGKEKESRVRAAGEEEEGRRSVGAQDRCNGGGEGMVSEMVGGGDRGDKWGNRGLGRSRSLSGADMSEAARARAGFLRQSMVERLPRAASCWDLSATRLPPHLPPANTLPMQKVGQFGRMPLSYASATRYAGSAGGIGRAGGYACPSVLFFPYTHLVLLLFPLGCPLFLSRCLTVFFFFFAIYASLDSVWISLQLIGHHLFLSAEM